MSFQIKGLDPTPFAQFFGMDDEALRAAGALREIVRSKPGSPCRVSLADAEIGEEVLLVNHEHQPAKTPYRAAHAIFVRRGAERRDPAPDNVPESLAIRQLSVREFDADHMMVRGEVVDGARLAEHLDALFTDPQVSYVHIHFAGRGCFAARADRAG